VAIAGDVLANWDLVWDWPGLQEPPAFFCVDRLQNRGSIRKLAELRPNLICFGHGPPLRDRAQLESFVAMLAPKVQLRSEA
jgi:glyoxylase-like metal-dependent hydrolase (beta-lactamase superfamily II)